MSGHRNGLIKAVHARARELGLDEASRRGLQYDVTGHESMSDMDAHQLRAVLAELDRRSGRGGGRRDELPDTPSARQAVALWMSAWNLGVVSDPSQRALCAYVRRQTGLDAARWATGGGDANKVVEGLKAWLSRAAGVSWAPYPYGGGFRPDLRVLEAQVRIVREQGIRYSGLPTDAPEPRAWPHDLVRDWQQRLGRVIRRAAPGAREGRA